MARAIPLDAFIARFPTELSQYELTVRDGEAPTCWVQLAKVGSWVHPIYGKFSITTLDLSEMHHNFHHVTPSAPTQLMVDYDHLSERPSTPDHGKAAGWLLDVQLRSGGDELWGLVEWTPTAAQQIRNKEFRFISPTFQKKYRHKDGRQIGTTLRASALTNRPFLEGMGAVTLTERNGSQVALADQSDIGFQDRMRRIREALHALFAGLAEPWDVEVFDFYEDRALFRRGGKTYRIPVTFAEDLTVTLGDPTEIILQDVPISAREELDMKTVKLTLPNGQTVDVPEETLLNSEPVRTLRDQAARQNVSAELTETVQTLQQEVVSLRETTASATTRADALELQLRETRIDTRLAAMKSKGLISQATADKLRTLALKDEATFNEVAATFTTPIVRLNEERGSADAGDDDGGQAAAFEREVEEYSDKHSVSLSDALSIVGKKNKAGAKAYALRERLSADAHDDDEDSDADEE